MNINSTVKIKPSCCDNLSKKLYFHYARGYVEAGRREGLCQVTCLENGIRMLRASYYNDRSREI